MIAWEQEIQKIVSGQLDEAAEIYHLHRPDLSLQECKQTIRDAAKAIWQSFRKKIKK